MFSKQEYVKKTYSLSKIFSKCTSFANRNQGNCLFFVTYIYTMFHLILFIFSRVFLFADKITLNCSVYFVVHFCFKQFHMQKLTKAGSYACLLNSNTADDIADQKIIW